MRVLVTGAAGNLGRPTVDRLLALGHQVRPTDCRSPADPPADWVTANLLEADAAGRLVDGCQAVVHLANHADPGGMDSTELYRQNMLMNLNVFSAAISAGVGQIVYASSVQVFAGGRRADDTDQPSCLSYLPLDGLEPPFPGNSYAASKEAAEALLRYYARQHEDLCATAVRWPLLANNATMQHFRENQPLDKPRHSHMLDVGFSFLALTDAASFVGAVLDRPQPGYEQFLPASPHNRMGWGAAQLVQTFYPSVPCRGEVSRWDGLVDLERIRRRFDWQPGDSLLPRPVD